MIISPSLTLNYTIPDRSKIWADSGLSLLVCLLFTYSPHIYVHTDSSMSNYMCCTYKRGGTKTMNFRLQQFFLCILLYDGIQFEIKAEQEGKITWAFSFLGFSVPRLFFSFFNIHTFHGIKTSIQVSHLCIVFKIQWGTMRPQKYGHIKRLWNKREGMREIHCIGSTESWWISVY